MPVSRQRHGTHGLNRGLGAFGLALVVVLVLSGCGPMPARQTPSSSDAAGATTSSANESTPSVTAPTLPVQTSPPWYLIRGGAKQDQGWAVAVDPAGDVYFGTHQQADSALFTDMVIYRLRPDGSEVWKARWGGRFAEKTFVLAPAGAVVYVGGLTYHSPGLTDADMAVLALDAADGSLLWEFTWGQGVGYEEVDGLALDGDGLYVSGWTTGKDSGNDLAVLKLDLSGNLVWAETWGDEGWDEADGQLVVRSDGVYVAGRYGGANMLMGGKGVVARFSKDTGELLDHVTWGGPLFTDALGMTADADYLYVVGLTLDKGKGGQIFLRKLTPELKLVWERVWGGRKSESARAVMVGDSGDILVAGETESQGAGLLDIALLRYTASGELQWERVWGSPQHDGALGIAGLGNDVYVAGKSAGLGVGGDDALLLHISGKEGRLPQPGDGPAGGG